MRVSWGPQHAASGHLRFILDIDGDIIVDATPDVGYTHRGVEKVAENRPYLSFVPPMERVCNPDSFNLSLGYVRAVEEAMGVEPPERARFIRVIMAELNRIMSHLYWLSLFTMSGGLATILMWTIADRELLLDLAEMVTGNRVTYAYFIPGGVREDLPEGFRERTLKTLDYLEGRLKDYYDMVFENKIYQMRAKGVGVLKAADAIKLGLAGPSLRGSGVKVDTRKDEPYEVYDDLEFDVITEEDGDSYARAKVRFHEMEESISIVRQALDKIPSGPIAVRAPLRAPAGEVYSRVESARGELGCYLVSDGGAKPYRLKISTPSFRNLAAIPVLCKGATLADVPIIYFSLDLWPLDIDR